MSHPTNVSCSPHGDGYTCRVTVGVDAGATTHSVSVSNTTLATLAPGTDDPVALVEASFAYLLEREPREAILATFDLPVIGRYFPGYEAEIRDRMATHDGA